ncbi:MAG: hypothetical protein K6G90_06795 [Clostridia bacterium]|nr:hypothetical protein [Clostridia bacterium]
MNAKKFIISTLSVLLAGLLLIAGLQIVVDPLFQYHTPWFGMKPVITDERYQYAGVAKNFDYDNVILGNSFCENFKPSSVESAFGGRTVKLAISGSTTKDWSKLLDIISRRAESPEYVISNIDPYSLMAASADPVATVPEYLYDNNLLNDTGYFFNFGTLSIAIDAIRQNIKGTVPDMDTVFLREARGRETVINGRDSLDPVDEEPSVDDALYRASGSLEVLLPYIESMTDTDFYFYFTPVSIIYWYKVLQERNADCWRAVFDMVCDKLTRYKNVRLFLWTDDEMLRIISDLDDYVDEAHYSPEICDMLVLRMKDGIGLISSGGYREKIDKLFDYTANFDYSFLSADSVS